MLKKKKKLLQLNKKINNPVKKWAKDLRPFSREDLQMVTSMCTNTQHHLSSGNCKSKPHLIWLLFFKNRKSQILAGMWRKIDTLIHCWWEYKMVQPLRKRTCWFLKKPDIKLLHDSAIPLPSVHTEQLKLETQTGTSGPLFSVVIIHIAKK